MTVIFLCTNYINFKILLYCYIRVICSEIKNDAINNYFFSQNMSISLLYEASFTRDCLQIYTSLSHCFNASETNGKLSVTEKHC